MSSAVVGVSTLIFVTVALTFVRFGRDMIGKDFSTKASVKRRPASLLFDALGVELAVTAMPYICYYVQRYHLHNMTVIESNKYVNVLYQTSCVRLVRRH